MCVGGAGWGGGGGGVSGRKCVRTAETDNYTPLTLPFLESKCAVRTSDKVDGAINETRTHSTVDTNQSAPHSPPAHSRLN